MRTSLKLTRSLSAFSLVELMIGVAIFGIVIGGVYYSLIAQYAMVQLNSQNLRATQILTDKMEMIRLCSWTQVTNSSFMPSTFNVAYNSNAGVVNAGLMYKGSVSVTTPSMTESYASNLALVTVTLTWTNSNVVRTRSVSTLVSQYGLQNSIY